MAEKAGLSKHQQSQAVNVANVPEEKFEVAVESESLPTVTELAETGKKTRPLVMRVRRKRRAIFCVPPTTFDLSRFDN